MCKGIRIITLEYSDGTLGHRPVYDICKKYNEKKQMAFIELATDVHTKEWTQNSKLFDQPGNNSGHPL